jgi:hypothetical protein
MSDWRTRRVSGSPLKARILTAVSGAFPKGSRYYVKERLFMPIYT